MTDMKDMIAVARRIAKANGVSVADVLAKYRQGVRKTALSYSDFFWGASDISLSGAEKFLAWRRRGRSARRGGARGLAPAPQDKGEDAPQDKGGEE